MQRITPCLWFDKEAEEAARFYVGIFKNSQIKTVSRYGDAGPMPKDTVMVVVFDLDGQEYLALNGGPIYHFSEAISLSVTCENQDEVDYYWRKLTLGGQEGPCGWLKDRYGVSWQVVPRQLTEMMRGEDPAKVKRMTEAMFKMKKLDIAVLEQAYEG